MFLCRELKGGGRTLGRSLSLLLPVRFVVRDSKHVL